jgi:hypothetical protein
MDPVMEEIHDGETVWRFDRELLTSRWVCLWVEAARAWVPSRRSISGLATVPSPRLSGTATFRFVDNK